MQTARYIWDQNDLQKTQVPFSGFSDYRLVLSDRKRTDHLPIRILQISVWRHKETPWRACSSTEEKKMVCLCTAVHRLINGSPQQNTLFTQQQFHLCCVNLKTCICSYFSFVFRRVQTAKKSLFSVRYSKSTAWRRPGEKKNRGIMDMPTTGSQPTVKPWRGWRAEGFARNQRRQMGFSFTVWKPRPWKAWQS